MIENRRQWENTRAKLRELEDLYDRKKRDSGDPHVRALTLQSIRKRINQFKEEIARYESRATVTDQT